MMILLECPECGAEIEAPKAMAGTKPEYSERRHPAQTWPPAYLDLASPCYELRISARQGRRLLAAGRLPPPDVNLSVSPSPKGRR